MKYSGLFFGLLLSLLWIGASSQSTSVNVVLEPVEIEGLGGVQSYAAGQSEGRWLILGGRLDGLHRRQPFASFDIAGHNTSLIVIDPEEKNLWRVSNSVLPVPVREQLSATNLEFYQDGDMLYVVGGYGFSNTSNDHITYPYLCAIDVRKTIKAIIKNEDITPFFRQIKDDKMAVTGGYLHKLYETYYLVGGQKFIGRYNPQGPDHGPGFVQEYTNAIRTFKIEDDGFSLNIIHLEEWYDEENLHRRDYNVVEQILPDGQFGLTAFSGVFQKNADLPFLNCVHIDSSGYSVQPDFNQYYNHYHCAYLPLYSQRDNEMSTLFFGGIAQYYDENGTLTRDDNVPFVKTIGRVTRTGDGKMAEYKLKTDMPGLLGAGSEFIREESVPVFDNGVLHLDLLEEDTTHVGYIFGGISSSAPNIFFINTGAESHASQTLYKVYLIQNEVSSTDELNPQSQGGLGMLVYPNPGVGHIKVAFNLRQASEVWVELHDIRGQMVYENTMGMLSAGTHLYEVDTLPEGHQVLILTLRAGNITQSQKLILGK